MEYRLKNSRELRMMIFLINNLKYENNKYITTKPEINY